MDDLPWLIFPSGAIVLRVFDDVIWLGWNGQNVIIIRQFQHITAFRLCRWLCDFIYEPLIYFLAVIEQPCGHFLPADAVLVGKDLDHVFFVLRSAIFADDFTVIHNHFSSLLGINLARHAFWLCGLWLQWFAILPCGHQDE